MLAVFLATAALSGLGSEWMGTPGAAGASGGVCGLIGAVAGASHRAGTPTSRRTRNGMLVWLASTLVFGVGFHADNWAHGFGALLGLGFGYAVRPRIWQRPAVRPVRIVTGALGLAGTLACLAIIFTRVPHPPPAAGDDVSVVLHHR
jgi:membrane associated rhomboid family serine protease